MNKKCRKNRRRRKDSGYIVPILCIVFITILSALLITFCLSIILSTEETPPVTSDSKNSSVSTIGSLPDSAGSNHSNVNPSTSVSEKPNRPITDVQDTTTVERPSTTPPVVTEPSPPVTDTPAATVPGGFKADLSAYEQYMDPTGDRWDDAYLMLVNAEHKLAEGQEKSYPTLGAIKQLSECDAYNFRYKPDISLNENAVMALSAMFIEAKANGIDHLDVTSAYRDYAYQNRLFNNNCNKTYHWLCEEEGCTADWIGKSDICPICGTKTTNNDSIEITQEEREANVATYSCAPGTSDHQTGLAIDIVQTSLPSEYLYLIQEFGETEAGIWLEENCWKFGFVLRFPPDKEAETGIIYEPWHFRFVGRTHAAQMNELNMCLEEYIEYLESTGYFD